jgi:hypothetical protein
MWSWITTNWQLWVGTAFGLVVAVATILYQRQPKQLDYEIRTDHQMLSPYTRDLAAKPDVIYEGVILKEPQILLMRFRNTGKKCISAADFKDGEPITIRYDQNPPFDVKVVRASRGVSIEGLADIAHDTDESEGDGDVRITPRLLNPGEWFDVQLLSDQPHDLVLAKARFADQKRPMRRINLSSRRHAMRDFKVGAIGLLMGSIATAFVVHYVADIDMPGYLVVAALIAGTLTLMLWALSRHFFPKIKP